MLDFPSWALSLFTYATFSRSVSELWQRGLCDEVVDDENEVDDEKGENASNFSRQRSLGFRQFGFLVCIFSCSPILCALG